MMTLAGRTLGLIVRLGTDLCRSLFAEMSVARLATVSEDGRPHLVPITFALLGPDVVVTAVDQKPKSTTNLRRLRNIRANPQACILADHYSDEWNELWWVRADGHANVLESGDDRQHAIGALIEKYAQYQQSPPAGRVIVVTVDTWTGWSAAT